MENKAIDPINTNILDILATDGRASYSEIAKQVGLSAPAVKERMLKLEDQNIITGYSAKISQHELGKRIGAFILVNVPYSQEKSFIGFVKETSDITTCHHLLGDSAFILRVQLKSMEALEALLQNCMRFGQTTTHMLLSKVK